MKEVQKDYKTARRHLSLRKGCDPTDGSVDRRITPKRAEKRQFWISQNKQFRVPFSPRRREEKESRSQELAVFLSTFSISLSVKIPRLITGMLGAGTVYFEPGIDASEREQPIHHVRQYTRPNQSINQSINQTFYLSKNQSINQSTNQWTNQSINQANNLSKINQSINRT